MAGIRANKCTYGTSIDVQTYFCPDKPSLTTESPYIIEYWDGFYGSTCLNNTPSFAQTSSYVIFAGQDYKLYKYDGNYIYPFGISDEYLQNCSWGLTAWEKNVIKGETTQDDTTEIESTGSGVATTFTITYNDFTDGEGNVQLPMTDLGIEVGDYLWTEGHVYKITAIDESAKTISFTFLNQDYYYPEGERGLENKGFSFCVAEPTLIDGTSGEYAPSSLEDGKLYEYVLTFTTKFGFESNPTSPKSIYATDTSAIKISISQLPMPASYISRINIYRSWGDKPNVWYYVDSIDVLNQPDFDVELYHIENYEDFDTPADLEDLLGWESGLDYTHIYAISEGGHKGLVIQGSNDGTTTASYEVAYQGNYATPTNSFWTEFKVAYVQGVVEPETDITVEQQGLSFYIVDKPTDLSVVEFFPNGYPFEGYGFTIIPYTGGTMENPYMKLVLWRIDNHDTVSILGVSQAFRDSSLPVEYAYDGSNNEMDLYYIGDSYRIFRDNSTGEISVYRKKYGEDTYSLVLTVYDTTYTTVKEIAFAHQWQESAYYDSGSGDWEYNITFPNVEYLKLYKTDNVYYMDFTPDSLLQQRIDEYKIVPNKAEGVLIAGNRFFAFYKNNLYVSDPMNYETIKQVVLFSRRIRAIASLELFGLVAVFCEDGVYSYDYNRGIADRVADNITTFNKNSCCTFNNLVYFLCDKGFYLFNGGKVMPVPNNANISALFRKYNNFQSDREPLTEFFPTSTLQYDHKNNAIIGIIGQVGIVYYLDLQSFSLYDFTELGSLEGFWGEINVKPQVVSMLSFLDRSINNVINMIAGYGISDDMATIELNVYYQAKLTAIDNYYITSLLVGQVDDIIRPRELFIEGEIPYQYNPDVFLPTLLIYGNYDLGEYIEEGEVEVITDRGKTKNEIFIDLYHKDVSTYKFKILSDAWSGANVPFKIRRIALRVQILDRRKRQWK